MAGALSDRINRRLLYAIAAIGSAIWVPVFFLMLGTPEAGASASVLLLTMGVIVGLAFHALMYGPQAAYITEQFDLRLRYAGSSLAYTLAGLVGGAVAPLIFTALLGTSGNWVPIALYLAVVRRGDPGRARPRPGPAAGRGRGTAGAQRSRPHTG